MELLQELTEQGREKYHWKDGEAHGWSGEHPVRMETSVNDRSYGWSNGKWELGRDNIKISFEGILIFTITLFFYGIGQIVELLCRHIVIDKWTKWATECL